MFHRYGGVRPAGGGRGGRSGNHGAGAAGVPRDHHRDMRQSQFLMAAIGRAFADGTGFAVGVCWPAGDGEGTCRVPGSIVP